ncbi:MAG TPA: PP2C family protein-serine/threonine phosphatase [Thermoanaerobaculia bacterium]
MTTTYPQASAASKSTPKHLYRVAETALGTLTAPSEEAMLRAIGDRMVEQFELTCGVRGWAAVSEPFETDLCFGELDLAERLVSGSYRDEADVIVWSLRGEREWRLAFRLASPPDETGSLLLHLSNVAAQQRVSESGWTSLLDRARAIQQSLIPPPPYRLLPGFEIHGRSDSAAVVGGDVFDVQSLTPDSISVLLADASGHGIPAALQARDIVIGLRMGHENHLKIGATIEKLNRVLCNSTLSSQFVSLVYGEIDRDGMFQYVNAGHPGPILVTPGELRFLPQTGPVLGVSPASRYRVAHAQLPPSSMLALYSDGVIECPSAGGEELSIERLVATCLDRAKSPAAEVVSAIFDAMAAHRGRAAVADDATVLVVQRA